MVEHSVTHLRLKLNDILSKLQDITDKIYISANFDSYEHEFLKGLHDEILRCLAEQAEKSASLYNQGGQPALPAIRQVKA